MTRYFCTLFDKNYLIKGLTMILSLKKYCANSKFYVLCLDNKTKNIIEKINIKSVVCLDLKEVENKELINAKKIVPKQNIVGHLPHLLHGMLSINIRK